MIEEADKERRSTDQSGRKTVEDEDESGIWVEEVDFFSESPCFKRGKTVAPFSISHREKPNRKVPIPDH